MVLHTEEQRATMPFGQEENSAVWWKPRKNFKRVEWNIWIPEGIEAVQPKEEAPGKS